MPNISITPDQGLNLNVALPVDQVANMSITSQEDQTLDLTLLPPGESSITLNVQGQGAANITVSQDIVIGATDLSVIEGRLETIENTILNFNTPPQLVVDSENISDTATVISGNVLTNDLDANGNVLSVTSVTYSSTVRTPGTNFTTTYGTFNISSDGSWTFILNNQAKSLTSAQSATEVFTYKVEDGFNGIKLSTLTLHISGTNNPPVALSDYVEVAYNSSTVNGNLLTNDSDVEGVSLTVTQFTITGDNSVYGATGDNILITNVGTISISQNGVFIFTPANAFSGNVPTVNYYVSDGVNVIIAQLVIVVQQSAVNVDSNPVTVAITGLRTFNVGPSQTYEELDTVPWATMQAGDVVNIYYRESPYISRIGISVQATASNPFIINGVTDSSGNRPKINGQGARTATGSMPGNSNNVFATNDETFGVITVKRKPSSSTTTNPAWISLQNLEVYGAASGNTAYNRDGSQTTWGFSAGIWLQPSKDITIRNCVIRNNALGVFSQAKIGYGVEGTTGESCSRIKLMYNRVYDNGAPGSDLYHNLYIQCFNPIIEGNYIGATITGNGSSYKSRSSGEIIRFNYIVASARALDLVQPYDENDTVVTDGISFASDFGTDHVYGNIIVNPTAKAWRPIHYGGDNGYYGEQDPASSPQNSPTTYRRQLYFWNNTFYSAGSSGAYQFLFQLSFPDTKVDMWNNIIGMYGASTMSLTQNSGTINMRGNNLLHSDSTFIDSVAPGGGYVTINRLGSIIASDPLWTSPSNQDFSLGSGSPAVNVSTTLPVGVPSNIPTNFKLEYYPRRQLNGLVIRPAIGNLDLGAIERDPNAPPISAPIFTSFPYLDSTDSYVVGSTVSGTDGTFIYGPATVTYQWQFSPTGLNTWTDIAGAVSNSITLSSNELGDIRLKVTLTNVVGSSSSFSASRTVTSSAASPVVQVTTGHTVYGVNNLTAISTFSLPPTVGNTLAVFAVATPGTSNSVTDNYGNTWIKRSGAKLSNNSRYLELYTCTVVAGKTGSNFTITSTSTELYVAGVVSYEIAGGYVSSSNSSVTGDGVSISPTIAASSANTRIVGVSMASTYLGSAITIANPFTQDAAFSYAEGYDPIFSAFHGVTYQAAENILTLTTPSGQYFATILALFE